MARTRAPAQLCSPHRTGGHGNIPDEVVAATRAGQATWADLTRDDRCSACIHWDASSRSKTKRRCTLFTTLMRRQGPPVPAAARACRHFEAAPVPPPAPPRTARDKFLDSESWRKSARTPGNLVRSVLNTPLSVVVFQRHGLWSWVVVHDDDGAPPIFSLHFFDSLEDAQIDCRDWEIAAVVDAGDRHD
jgi:hypothetical protein